MTQQREHDTLMEAAKFGNNAEIRQHLNEGASEDACQKALFHAFQYALRVYSFSGWRWMDPENNQNSLEILFERAGGKKVFNEKGLTPFLYSAQNGDLLTLELWLNLGIDVRETAPDGKTAFHYLETTLPKTWNPMYVRNLFTQLAERGLNPHWADDEGKVFGINNGKEPLTPFFLNPVHAAWEAMTLKRGIPENVNPIEQKKMRL